MHLSKDLFDFVVLLNKHKVDYLIVGGYAVGYYGYARFTGDIDVWINISEENADKVKSVVDEFGVGFLFTREDFLKENYINQIGNPPLRIDIISNIDGVQFKDCFERKKEIKIETEVVPLIEYTDLLKNKLATGRGKDKIDVEELEKINIKRNKN